MKLKYAVIRHHATLPICPLRSRHNMIIQNAGSSAAKQCVESIGTHHAPLCREKFAPLFRSRFQKVHQGMLQFFLKVLTFDSSTISCGSDARARQDTRNMGAGAHNFKDTGGRQRFADGPMYATEPHTRALTHPHTHRYAHTHDTHIHKHTRLPPHTHTPETFNHEQTRAHTHTHTDTRRTTPVCLLSNHGCTRVKRG